MYVIAIENPKGGTGKSTLTSHLARYYQLRGAKVLIVCRDPQGSLRDWQAVRETNEWRYRWRKIKTPYPKVLGIDKPILASSIKDVGKGYDLVLIDGASKANIMMLDSVMAADFVLMPIAPSGLDLWGGSDLVSVVKKRIEATNNKLKTAVVINEFRKNNVTKRIIRAVQEVHKLPLLENNIRFYTKLIEVMPEGLTVLDFKAKIYQPPSIQIAGIADEIREIA